MGTSALIDKNSCLVNTSSISGYCIGEVTLGMKNAGIFDVLSTK